MIVSETFLNKARSAFDLNEYEIKTWTALLSRNESTAGELAEISTVPRSRVYDILESLTAKGFVVKKKGSPIKYKTVTPEEALKAAKENSFKQAELKSTEFEEVRSTGNFKELEKLYKKGSSEVASHDLAGLIKGRNNIHSQMLSLVSNAKKTISIVTTRDGLDRKSDKLGAELKKAKSRGVSIKIAAPLNSMSEVSAAIQDIAEFRKIDGKQSRFAIADSKSMLMLLSHDNEVHENYDFGVWVDSSFMAKGFEHIFENTWKGMKKL